MDKLFHFIWIEAEGSHDFSVNEYYSIYSNIVVNKPSKVYIHTNIYSKLKDNPWIRRLRCKFYGIVELMTYDYNVLSEYKGHKVPYAVHRSDILRLMTLISNGGVYVDCDMIALNPLPESWFNDSRLRWSKENCEELAFCNNFILSPKNHQFLIDCLEVFDNYDCEIYKPNTPKWAYLDVTAPVEIYNSYPKTVKRKIDIRDAKEFQPLYLDYKDTLKLFFEDHFNEIKDSYYLHTWNTRNYGILRNFTEEYILGASTTYTKAIQYSLLSNL